MEQRDRTSEIFGSLARQGLHEAEVYLKTGRSRRLAHDPQGMVAGESSESGWAIRASGSRSSMFIAGTGLPDAALPWPEPDGQPMRLPPPVPVSDWSSADDLDLPLMAEGEARATIESIGKALESEVPGSRILRAYLDEGSSETSILNTHGLEVSFQRRAASLFVQAVGPWPGSAPCQLSWAARKHHDLQSDAAARRLANRLLLTRDDSAPDRERGEVLLGSPVAARLLVSLLPMLVGRRGESLARQLRSRQGRIASRHLTVIDDGRLPGGVLSAPVDGEGRPTGSQTLIEEGRFRRALVDWREMRDPSAQPIGCMRREGWRDLPQIGPSHLYIQPRQEVAVSDLLSSIARGYYLVEPLGAGKFDFAADRFRLPVCGFTIRQGAATAPLSKAWLEGGIRAFLEGIQGVARDLGFEPLGAMVGSPSILVGGFGLRGDRQT